MNYSKVIIIAGALIALLPFIGLPLNLKNWIFLGLGIIILVMGVILHRRFKQGDSVEIYLDNNADDSDLQAIEIDTDE